MIIPVFKVTSKIYVGIKETILVAHYAQTKLSVPVVKFSLSALIARIVNTVTMFLPLKLLLVMSGSKSIEIVDKIKTRFGLELYIIIIILLLFFLYTTNFTFTRWLEKSQTQAIVNLDSLKGRYYLLGVRVGSKALKASSDTSIKLISDWLFLLLITSIMIFISHVYAFFYLAIIFIFLFLVEYLVFTNNKFYFLDKVAISEQSTVGFFAILIYYFCFIFIVILQLNDQVSFFGSIVLLILSKVSNSSMKSIANKMYFLRLKFPHIYSNGIVK